MFRLKTQEKSIEIKTALANELPDILYIDELRFRQILINLVSNAVKFTERGEVSISVKMAKHRRMGSETVVDLELAVSDTGIGIAPEFQKQIFEVFKQQDEQDSRKYGGTGLGLAITKRLVQLMGGTLSLSSEVGKGSTFYVTLPDVLSGESGTKNIVSGKAQSRKLQFKDASILIADDVMTNRALLKGAIKGKNLTFLEAEDGEEAIELIQNEQIDIILLDLNMPKASGFRVAEFVKDNPKYRSIPIIAISATQLTPAEVEKAGYFECFLAKPFSVKELQRWLAKFIPSFETGVEQKPSSSLPVGDSVSKIKNKEQFREELSKLEQELQLVRKSTSFKELGNFANDLSEIAGKYGVPGLSQKSSHIVDAVNNFDIEKITKQFTELSDLIKHLGNELRKES